MGRLDAKEVSGLRAACGCTLLPSNALGKGGLRSLWSRLFLAGNAPSNEMRAVDAQFISILSVPCVEEVAAFGVLAGAAVLADPFLSALAGADFEVPRLAALAATTWMMFIMPKSS